VFFLALFLLALGALGTYKTVYWLLDAQRWVAHSRDVQSALANISPVISRAGRSRTEYVQSGDPILLDQYQTAVTATQDAVALVRKLTADNPLQQQYCTQLENLTRQRVDLMAQSIDLKRSGQATLENEAQITQSIVRVAEQMDSLMLQMQRLEEQLLSERQQRSQSLFRQEIVLITAAFVVAVLLLSLHYYLLNRELQARQRAEESLRKLNVRLLELQDAERRRISRELHESIGQYLSGLKMSLEVVRKSIPQNALLAECISILDKSIGETRSISQLLHPPLLDEIGFASAARWYVEGFAERSGVRVELNLPETLGRFASSIELALFRVLQESLTALRRQSKNPDIEVTVRLLANRIEMRVRDRANRLSEAAMQISADNTDDPGLGLTGMKERIRELGGRLDILLDDCGTVIIAVLPVVHSTAEQAEIRSALTRK
jgi:signal transduction histidine kinase